MKRYILLIVAIFLSIFNSLIAQNTSSKDSLNKIILDFQHSLDKTNQDISLLKNELSDFEKVTEPNLISNQVNYILTFTGIILGFIAIILGFGGYFGIKKIMRLRV
jgi:predicted PurR-regulated permease PerM